MRFLVVVLWIWLAGVGAAFAQSGEAKLEKELQRSQKQLSELTDKEQALSKKKSLTDEERGALDEVR